MPKPLEAINDFVVKFANVNGSGSASANALFAKSILRMGVPASSRNIFPSNIQGLPTWFEVRVSEKGHLGRRGGVDLMVAMNPQTWDEDIAEIEPGGYLFYDSTRPLPSSMTRDDISSRASQVRARAFFSASFPSPINSTKETGAPSPGRFPSLTIRVYPPVRDWYRGLRISKSFLTKSRLRTTDRACRRAWRSPRFPRPINFSARGRSSLALASVVFTLSCSSRELTKLRSIAVRWLVVRPNFLPAI
jgi:Pyruvate/2-oxoacid:ferredoxin oxidoreductase gamma subunit